MHLSDKLLALAILFIKGGACGPTHAELYDVEESAKDLNTSNRHEVELFIKYWASTSRNNANQHPFVGSQLPLSEFRFGLIRRDGLSCTFESGNGCTGEGALCCGNSDDGWCCASSTSCCQGDSSGCCADGSSCCGDSTGANEGSCCSNGQTCCIPSGSKPFCCDGDQTCDTDNLVCVDPTVTVTATTTIWQTGIQVETVTDDATVTDTTVSTEETTIYITISNAETGTTTVTETTTITNSSSGNARRFLQDNPPPTQIWEDSEHSAQPFIVRPAASLNAIAEALIRRGVAIVRRDTSTETNWVTVEATEIVTQTDIATNWITEWSTSVEIDKVTITNFDHAKDTVTKTITVTKYVAASAETGKPEKKSTSTGTIAGAAVGGGVGFILIVVAAACLWRRSKRKVNEGSTEHFSIQPQGAILPPMTDAQGIKLPLASPASPASPSPPPAPIPSFPISHPELDHSISVSNYHQVDGPAMLGVHDQRHGHRGSWGSNPPPTYVPLSPHELSASPHVPFSELPTAPGTYTYEMPDSNSHRH